MCGSGDTRSLAADWGLSSKGKTAGALGNWRAVILSIGGGYKFLTRQRRGSPSDCTYHREVYRTLGEAMRAADVVLSELDGAENEHSAIA